MSNASSMNNAARRSQGRRSSNTLPIRPVPSGTGFKPSSNNLSTSTVSSAQKQPHLSSIPRPSISSAGPRPSYGQNHNQSVAYGTTPSKAQGSARCSSATTPQKGNSTPQSRGNLIHNMSATATKPFLKETRNLNDKTVVRDMMANFANFLSNLGYPEQVTPKELQKIDKQNFVKYFNFIDSNFQLQPRFNEDELIKYVKDLGYCGTLAKSALVSIGALHSTSQIYGLFSWLSDFVRMFNLEAPNDDESFEKIELGIFLDGYEAWCREQTVDLTPQFQALYKSKHQIEDGRAEKLDLHIASLCDERSKLEKKSSQNNELKEEANRWNSKLEEIMSKEAELQQRYKEMCNEEKHLNQRLTETKDKTAAARKEIDELLIAAKNCKVSADEARRIKAEIATNKRDLAAASEQRAEVSKLFEKREIQLGNIAAEYVKHDRELNVDLMDMGMTAGPDVDRKDALKKFLDNKTNSLSEIEGQCIAMNESKERVLAEISSLKLEIKHSETSKNRLEENIKAIKADRDELERLYLSQLSELESLSDGPRSDPLQMRQQYELETLRQKLDEQKSMMSKQENELQLTVANYAKDLEEAEAYADVLHNKAIDYYAKLAVVYQNALEEAKHRPISTEMMKNMLPENPLL